MQSLQSCITSVCSMKWWIRIAAENQQRTVWEYFLKGFPGSYILDIALVEPFTRVALEASL